MRKKGDTSGLAAILVIVAVVVLAGLVVGYFLFSDGRANVLDDYMHNGRTDDTESYEEISDSDKTTDIEKELDSTELELEEMEKDLDDLDAETDSL